MMLMKSEDSSKKLLRAWRGADASALSKQAPLQARPFSSAEVYSCPRKGSWALSCFPCVTTTSVHQPVAEQPAPWWAHSLAVACVTSAMHCLQIVAKTAGVDQLPLAARHCAGVLLKLVHVIRKGVLCSPRGNMRLEKGCPMCGGAEQVAVDAHEEKGETLKAEVPHREPEAGAARSLGQGDRVSEPLQEGHAQDIETGCADAASSASSAADQGAEPQPRGALATLLWPTG